MFFVTPLIGAAALLSAFAAAQPRPDSAIGSEVAVSAPNGIIMSDTAELARQTAVTQTDSAASTVATSVDSSSGSSTAQLTSSQAWTTSAALATTTSSPWKSSSSSVQGGSGWGSSPWKSPSPTPSYGSGSSKWGNQNYNSCVQQCVASYGGPPATYTPPTATSASSSGSSGSSGSGATHTVIVAPTKGVLRFVPFAINASVGDTIQFMWGANNHTVTKSSSLTPCNKTADKPFGSGAQNKGFVFTQVVNDTNPTFFYCGIPTHCEKGMFGIINPPNALGSPTSASAMMQPLAMNNSDMAAYATYTDSHTAGNSAAARWGGGMDMSALPSWSHTYAAENIMYTRNFLAANSEVLQQDGTVNLGSAGSTPLMFPKDLSAALNSTGATSSATSPVSPSSSSVPSASSVGSSAESSASSTSAAISTSSSKVLLGLVVGFSTLMML